MTSIPVAQSRPIAPSEGSAEPASRIAGDLERVVVGDQVIVTRDGRVHLSLDLEEAVVLEQLYGTHTVDEVAASHPAVNVVGLVDDFEAAGYHRFVALVHRFGGRRLLDWPVAVAAIVAAILGTVAAVGANASRGPGLSGSATLVALIVLGWIATLFHETAHALVIHDHGRRVGRVGVGFYWGSLSFYVDATDALFLPRRQRAIQAVAGPLADVALIAICAGTATALGPSPKTPGRRSPDASTHQRASASAAKPGSQKSSRRGGDDHAYHQPARPPTQPSLAQPALNH